MDDLQAVIWEADPVTFQFQYVSRGAEAILGYPTEHWLTQPTFWVDLLYPDDREHAHRECLTAVAECRDHDFEYRVRTRSGEVRWLRDIVTVICEGGRPVTLRGLMVDITLQKTDDADRGREERYRRVALEHSLDIVTIIDARGVIQYSSPSVTRVLGYSAEDRAGRSLFDLVHADDASRVRATLEAVFTSGGVPPFVHARYRHADGTWRVLEATGQRLDDSSGPLFVISARDVTERMQLEEQFRHAQKMEALGRLTGSVAHDFNNLLMTIGGNAEVAIGSEASFGVRVELLEIKKAAELAAALTRQLLAFSRRQQAATLTIDVNASLEGIRGMLERVLGHSVNVELSLAATRSHVRLGPGLLEQVILNLAINSRDAMPAGGGRLTLSTTNVILPEVVNGEPTGRTMPYLALKVADNGAGMTPEIRARIFEPYFTTKAPTKGTGLGLPTVYGIIREGNGRIEVDTELGKGTTFSIFLPLNTASTTGT
jgi:two-component system cell cycle sensor histidine kinase/response regulator CckA